MTIKQKHALDLAWRCLLACCERQGRAVSAGELAREMGVCRNTAYKRLMELIAEDAICFRSEPYRTGFRAVYWIAGVVK